MMVDHHDEVGDFEEGRRRYGALKPTVRHRLLNEAENWLATTEEFDDALTVLQIIFSCFPESADVIQRILTWRQRTADFEVHFLLFCHLAHWNGYPLPFRRFCMRLTEEYLMSIDRNTALCTWMAAHMLSDHWRISESLPVLLKVAAEARYAIARRWSIYGLEELAERTLSERNIRKIGDLLHHVSRTDRSPHIRDIARDKRRAQIRKLRALKTE